MHLVLSRSLEKSCGFIDTDSVDKLNCFNCSLLCGLMKTSSWKCRIRDYLQMIASENWNSVLLNDGNFSYDINYEALCGMRA